MTKRAGLYPTMIFDDEADYASQNTDVGETGRPFTMISWH